MKKTFVALMTTLALAQSAFSALTASTNGLESGPMSAQQFEQHQTSASTTFGRGDGLAGGIIGGVVGGIVGAIAGNRFDAHHRHDQNADDGRGGSVPDHGDSDYGRGNDVYGRGETFHGVGGSAQQAQVRAKDKCEAYSCHCRPLGCRGQDF